MFLAPIIPETVEGVVGAAEVVGGLLGGAEAAGGVEVAAAEAVCEGAEVAGAEAVGEGVESAGAEVAELVESQQAVLTECLGDAEFTVNGMALVQTNQWASVFSMSLETADGSATNAFGKVFEATQEGVMQQKLAAARKMDQIAVDTPEILFSSETDNIIVTQAVETVDIAHLDAETIQETTIPWLQDNTVRLISADMMPSDCANNVLIDVDGYPHFIDWGQPSGLSARGFVNAMSNVLPEQWRASFIEGVVTELGFSIRHHGPRHKVTFGNSPDMIMVCR